MPLSPQRAIPVLVALIAAGLVGNRYDFAIFSGIEFLFGSIFTMLALQTLGLWPGVVAAIAISSITLVSFNHPYAIPIMTAEVMVVGWLSRRKGVGLVFADTLYWFCLGMPLFYLFYRELILVHPSNAQITAYKQAINGIANTLVARLLFMVMNARSRQGLFSLREVVFNLLALVVLFPSLALIIFESRQEVAEIDQNIRESMIQVSRHTGDSLGSWLGNKSARIGQLAWRVANGSPDLQNDLDFLRSLDPDLLAVGVIDKEARSTAFSPALDEEGVSTIGKDFSDRPYLVELKRDLQPRLSEVMISKIGRPDPISVILAPVVVAGDYDGYAAGLLNLNRVRQILTLPESRYGLSCTLLDQNQVVIASNRSDLAVMAPFSRGEGTMRKAVGGLNQWLPTLPANTADAERWRQSSYVVQQAIGALGEWQLIIEQPVALFQQKLFAHFAEEFELIFLILLVTLGLAEVLSRRFMLSVHNLQKISSGLSERLESVHEIHWPASLIREVDQLIVNFREMATALVERVNETRRLNVTLEERVGERTRALQESEAKYRIIFENKVYAIYIFDLETRLLLDVNDAFAKIYGYSREEALSGMKVDAINTWAEDSDLVVQEVMREDTMFIPLRFHRKRDGSIFPVEIVGGPYLWRGRRVVFAIANDITERRRATEALMERTAQLEDLTRNLEVRIGEEVGRRRKNEQLLIQQAKLAAMGEMLGAIAHQWRQPLNTLGLCIQNIKDSHRYGELNQGYLDTTVRQAMEQIGHMSRTIDDFRTFFRPDKDKVVFDTMQAVGEVLTLFSAQLTAHDIAYTLTCRTHGREFDTVGEIITCPEKLAEGYRNEFEHVILNLLTNAKDAICEGREKGEGTAGGKGRIAFEFLNADQELIITVSDNGGGIPEPILGRIFEPYFTTKEPAKGTGIGLYLSKIIIEDHMHGSLTARNTEQGAAFVITVPAIGEAAGV